MDNYFFGFDYTWKDLFEETFHPKRKDTSFTANDIIRFYENNLDFIEKEEVLNYFCDICPSRELPEPIPEPLPLPPIAPPIPLPPIVIPPPPNVPELPVPVDQIWLLPVWPFIIPELLPADILNYLFDELGIQEIISQRDEYKKLLDEKVTPTISRGVSPHRLQHVMEVYNRYERDMYQYETKVSQLETDLAEARRINKQLVDDLNRISKEYYDNQYVNVKDEYVIWDKIDQIPPSDPDYERENEEYTENEWDIIEDFPEAPYEEIGPTNREILQFYYLEAELQKECDRLGIEYYWRMWYHISGEIWYIFKINGEDWEFNISGVEKFLVELKKLPTPDEIYI